MLQFFAGLIIILPVIALFVYCGHVLNKSLEESEKDKK